MSNRRKDNKPALYEIRVKGRLESRWSEWFDGFDLAQHADDETILTGQVTDQPALHGLLAKVRDLGLPLLSVIRLEEDKP